MTRQVSLPAYENDVLHALSESGGLPGNEAKSEVIILRGASNNPKIQDQAQRAMEDPLTCAQLFASSPSVTRIPLRMGPHDPPVQVSQDDIILHTGDIIFVQSRESEVFYTGGLLHGGQFPIPATTTSTSSARFPSPAARSPRPLAETSTLPVTIRA